MRIFDSNISRDFSAAHPKGRKEVALRGVSKYRADFRGTELLTMTIVGKAPLGEGLLSITILMGDEEVIFDETVALARNNKEFSFSIDSNKDGLFRLILESAHGGKCIVSRVVISDNKVRKSKLEKNIRTLKKYNYEYLKNLHAKIGIIVPYSIHGGAEIYLKNILNEISLGNTQFEILYLSKNSKSLSSKYREIYAGSISRLKSQIILGQFSHIIFYNSLSVYNLLNSLKEERLISSKVVEIYHSDFTWSDSVSKLKDRSNVDISIRVADGLLNDVAGLRRVETIPVGIDLGRFKNKHKKSLRSKYNIDDKRPIIGIVARMSPEKNIDYALSIASRMNDFLFLFLGTGPMLSDYKSKNKLDNVLFLGHKENIEDYHSIFDALLLTSKIEGTPISILEAMASERVVFSTKVGMVPSIISDGENGFFITGSVEEDVEIIKNNFNNRDVGKCARKSVLKHSIELISKTFINVLFDKYEFLPDEEPVSIGEFI